MGADRHMDALAPRDAILVGPVCAGKSTVAADLAAAGRRRVHVAEAIADIAGVSIADRDALLAAGLALESDRPGDWLGEWLATVEEPVVVDSVRTAAQLTAARAARPSAVTIGVWAPEAVRRSRWTSRRRPGDAKDAFEHVARSVVEREAERLSRQVRPSIDTSTASVEEIRGLVLAFTAAAC